MTPLAPVLGLGLTQIIGFGTLMYAYGIVLPDLAEDLGLPLPRVFGLLSIGLFVGGLIAPLAGRAIDVQGGRRVLTLGSVGAAVALAGFATIQESWGLLVAVTVMEAAAMFVLYDAAFAAIAQIRRGPEARRAITQITLVGGFASTIFWPLTLWLCDGIGWRVTLLAFAAMNLLLCAPLHWTLLRGADGGRHGAAPAPTTEGPVLTGPTARRAMIWMVLSFTASGYVFGAIMVLWVEGFVTLGLSEAAAVAAGALIGPAKVGGRVVEMLFGRSFHPLTTALTAGAVTLPAFAVLFGLGASATSAMVFALLFGAGDGLRAIVRGTLPLALFGTKNYGARLGWISFIRMGVNASAPFVFATLMTAFGGWAAFAGMAACVALGLACLLMIPRADTS